MTTRTSSAGACDGDLELVRHHLRCGVDVDFIHPELMSTALVAAIEAGRADVALALLDHGADPTLRSPLEAMTPLEAAEAAGSTPWPRDCALTLITPPSPDID